MKGNRFRQERHALLCSLLAVIPRPLSILDVGGTVEYWLDYGIPNGCHITLLNQGAAPQKLVTPFAYCQGDACAMPQFMDRQFDLVFSNSVIEHVGNWSRQLAMAHEVQRIGRYFFVQTPARSFVIEPHYRLPLVQFLPESGRLAVARLGVKLGFYPPRALRNYSAVRLLSAREMRAVFPAATLWRERFGPLIKSFVVHNIAPHPEGSRSKHA